MKPADDDRRSTIATRCDSSSLPERRPGTTTTTFAEARFVLEQPTGHPRQHGSIPAQKHAGRDRSSERCPHAAMVSGTAINRCVASARIDSQSRDSRGRVRCARSLQSDCPLDSQIRHENPPHRRYRLHRPPSRRLSPGRAATRSSRSAASRSPGASTGRPRASKPASRRRTRSSISPGRTCSASAGPKRRRRC